MRKLVVIQTILLVGTIVLGALIKNGIVPEISQYHGLVGRLSGLVGLVILIMAFVKKQLTIVKTLSVLNLFLVIIAAFGGASFSQTNSSLSFSLMILSGTLALIVSIILAFKLRNTLIAPGKSPTT